MVLKQDIQLFKNRDMLTCLNSMQPVIYKLESPFLKCNK